MNIVLIVVGKTADKYIEESIVDYVKRLSRYVKLDIVVIPDVRNAKNLSQEQLKEKESENILTRLSPQDKVVLLDERGEQMGSEQFAGWLQENMNRGTRKLVFVIGGAYGFSQAMYERAVGKISLSKMTFSHQMVRLLFAEQLYRSFTILAGQPYHHK